MNDMGQAARSHLRAGPLTQAPAALFPPTSQSRAEFARCYRDLMPRLTVFVMRHGADRNEAAEAAQSAFALAWESWDTIDHPAAWLRRVAFRNLVKHRAQREHSQAELPDRAGGPSPAEIAEMGTQEATVLSVLASLPMRQRQAFAWAYDGFSPYETAEHVGISPEAVRQNLARARRHLRQAWDMRKEDAE